MIFAKIYKLLKIAFYFLYLKNNHAFNKITYNRAWCKIHNVNEIVKEIVFVKRGFPDGAMVKIPPANAGDTRDLGLNSGLERSPGIGNGNPLGILAWEILWTEEHFRL